MIKENKKNPVTKNKKRYLFTLSNDINSKLVKCSDETGISKSKLVEFALRSYFEENK